MDYQKVKMKIPSQREKIIHLLKNAGEEGITNIDLVKISYRYGARISELYERGYDIEMIPVKAGVTKYILRKTPSQEKCHESAEEILLQQLTQKGGTVMREILKTLLKENGFKISRKQNWFKERMNKAE